MDNHIRVTLEIGPKGKKAVAVATDWPGLQRGAATGEAAMERSIAYVPPIGAKASESGLPARRK